MAHVFLGLDGEMTGADLAAGGKLIQIGLATGVEPADWTVTTIGWERGEYVADPTAMAVHGISEEEILAAPRAPEVDERLLAWCLEHGGSTEKRALVPVGWNVGAFDMPFVRDALPRTHALLSRRTVDLNAACFTLAGALTVGGSSPKWTGFKRMAKRHAEQALAAAGLPAAWHDAGYDALASLLAWRWLRSLLT